MSGSDFMIDFLVYFHLSWCWSGVLGGGGPALFIGSRLVCPLGGVKESRAGGQGALAPPASGSSAPLLELSLRYSESVLGLPVNPTSGLPTNRKFPDWFMFVCMELDSFHLKCCPVLTSFSCKF